MDATIDEEDNTPVRSSRLRILAVRELGYTHTEYGKRTLCRIAEELAEAAEMRKPQISAGDNGEWIDEEVI